MRYLAVRSEFASDFKPFRTNNAAQCIRGTIGEARGILEELTDWIHLKTNLFCFTLLRAGHLGTDGQEEKIPSLTDIFTRKLLPIIAQMTFS